MSDERAMLALPRKVVDTATRAGVHNDCIASERPCQKCAPLIMEAMHFHYGHLDTDHEVLVAVIQDFMEEM